MAGSHDWNMVASILGKTYQICYNYVQMDIIDGKPILARDSRGYIYSLSVPGDNGISCWKSANDDKIDQR